MTVVDDPSEQRRDRDESRDEGPAEGEAPDGPAPSGSQQDAPAASAHETRSRAGDEPSGSLPGAAALEHHLTPGPPPGAELATESEEVPDRGGDGGAPAAEPAEASPAAAATDATPQPPPTVPPTSPPPPSEPGTASPPVAGALDRSPIQGDPPGDVAAPPEEGDLPTPTPQAVVPPRPPLPTPRVLAIANQKGGVGKTTTAVNLGAALAELGFRVLIVDLDPQGNATTGLGIDIRNLDTTVYDCIMTDAPLEDCVEATSVRNLFVAPSNMDLAGAEIELVPTFSRELKLRRAVEAVKDDYDYILVDCPPSLGLLTVNGLAAADDVVVPIQCEYYALEGLGQLVNNVQLVRANLNPVLDIRGIVLTMYDGRTKLADQVVNEVRAHFGDRVYATVVPRTVRLSEAPSFGQPIIVFDTSSRGSEAYRALAREVSGRTPDHEAAEV